MWEEEGEEGGGKQIADDITLLEQAGEEAAAIGGKNFKCKRGADAPLAAHGDAEERAADEKDGHGGGEGAGELEDGERDHIEHQGRSAAVALCHPAKEEGADGAHGERPEGGLGGGGKGDVEGRGNGTKAEREQEVVEGVE